MSSVSSTDKQNNYLNKIKKQNSKNIKENNNTEKINPIIQGKKEIIIKTVEDEEEEKKQNLTKLKLITALNNINDQINVKIDSKDRFKNSVLDLDCFINRPSSRRNKTVVNNNYTYGIEKSKDKVESSSSLKDIDEQKVKRQNQKEEYGNDDGTNDDDKIKENNIGNNNPKKEGLNNLVSLSLKKEEDKKHNNFIKENNDKKIKDNLQDNNENNKNNESDDMNADNNNINNININYNNSFKKQVFKEIPKPDRLFEKTPEKQDKDDKIANLNNNINVNNDLNQKLTLYNLDNEDKSFLKKMEKNGSFVITDISFLNKKNISSYNISLNNFDIKKILNYYIYLVKENKKEQISILNLKNNISDLREELLNIKKNEAKIKSEKNKINAIEKDNQNISLKITKNIKETNDRNSNINNNNFNKKEQLDILSRYQKDLNYFEELINKMNAELKTI